MHELEIELSGEAEAWGTSSQPTGSAMGLRGDRFAAALRATFARIEQAPLSFARTRFVLRPTLRRAKVLRFPYVVFYYVLRGEPYIVAVAHGKRAEGLLVRASLAVVPTPDAHPRLILHIRHNARANGPRHCRRSTGRADGHGLQ